MADVLEAAFARHRAVPPPRRAGTGVPIHRYLTRLRLRAALECLAYRREDLTALAMDLGFASHSHFADAFRGRRVRSAASRGR